MQQKLKNNFTLVKQQIFNKNEIPCGDCNNT